MSLTDKKYSSGTEEKQEYAKNHETSKNEAHEFNRIFKCKKCGTQNCHLPDSLHKQNKAKSYPHLKRTNLGPFKQVKKHHHNSKKKIYMIESCNSSTFNISQEIF